MSTSKYNINPGFEKYFVSKRIKNFTEVQDNVIPLLLDDKNVFVESPTGSGKTLAFLIPIITKLNLESKTIQAIIFSPTRELAKQLEKVLKEIEEFIPVTHCLITGGGAERDQINSLDKKDKPQIVIATTERFQKVSSLVKVDLTGIKYVVVDEADMCLEFGSLLTIKNIFDKYKRNVIWALFSATLPLQLQNYIKKELGGNIKNIIVTPNITEENLNYLIRADGNKKQKLLEILSEDIYNPFIALIFFKSNEEAKSIFEFLKENGVKKIGLYTSELTQRERNQVIKQLQQGNIINLITTDVMSRGIDLEGVSHIINYSFPQDLVFYKHRIGRTNRNTKGIVFTMYEDKEKEIVDKLVRQNPSYQFVKYKVNEKK